MKKITPALNAPSRYSDAMTHHDRSLFRLMRKSAHALTLLVFALMCMASPATGLNAPTGATFHNPLLPSGPDPWVTYRDGYYYYMNTTGINLTIWKTRDITDLKHARKTVVWTPPADGPDSKELWAPELHWIDGKWYIYFAADAGDNADHRLWVVENVNADPTEGHWTLKGKISDSTGRWAIDPTVFEDHGKWYIVWSGWEGASNGQQNLYIARLQTPWTIGSARVRISSPQFPWEEVGDNYPPGMLIALPHINVNEGPEILQHGGRIFLIYSASGCWTNYYELGMLSASAGSNLLDVSSWQKATGPVFWQSPEAKVFGPGHNTFFKSPDGKQDWILYHANSASNDGCGNRRSPRAQPFEWNQDGTPNFGRPAPLDRAIPKPSGTP